MKLTKMFIEIFKIGFRLGASELEREGLTNDKLEVIATEQISSYLYTKNVLGVTGSDTHAVFLVDDHFDDELDA